MSDAPELIYVDYSPHTESYQYVSTDPDCCGTEYIRADRVRVTGFEDAPQWQPIDSAPRDGTVFLATHNRGCDGSFREPYQTFWGTARPQRGEFDGHVANSGKPWWLSYGGEKLAPTPSHWMPLPKPPT